MKYKRMKLVRANYSYHPDFIEDKAEPNGYRVLDTGRYIVEWTLRDVCIVNPLKTQKNYKCSFLTAEEAERFIQKLYNNLDKFGTLLDTEENQFYLGK